MAKEVSLSQLREWIKKNEGRTWFWRGPTPHEKRTLEIKYLTFSLDTRDMRVFHIKVRGLGDEFTVDFRDDKKDWTLLDLLQSKLKSDEESE